MSLLFRLRSSSFCVFNLERILLRIWAFVNVSTSPAVDPLTNFELVFMLIYT